MNKTKQTNIKKTIAGISVSDLTVTLNFEESDNFDATPPDEFRRGVEIVVYILVVVGEGRSRKRLW